VCPEHTRDVLVLVQRTAPRNLGNGGFVEEAGTREVQRRNVSRGDGRITLVHRPGARESDRVVQRTLARLNWERYDALSANSSGSKMLARGMSCAMALLGSRCPPIVVPDESAQPLHALHVLTP
jgi:hypothetical protein